MKERPYDNANEGRDSNIGVEGLQIALVDIVNQECNELRREYEQQL